MYRTVFLLGMVLFFGLLGGKSVQAQNAPTEVVFSEVTRVTETFSDCHNEGKTYHLSITGIADGEEKTVGIGPINGTSNRQTARDRMADFCEKAALLTKSQPDKYNLYFKSDSRGGGGGNPGDGTCPSFSSSGSTIIELVCELR